MLSAKHVEGFPYATLGILHNMFLAQSVAIAVNRKWSRTALGMEKSHIFSLNPFCMGVSTHLSAILNTETQEFYIPYN